MSSVTRRFAYVDGAVIEVTEQYLPSDVGITSGYSEGKPGKSIGMSCHPTQIAERNELLRRHGITGVHYDPSKRDNCVITSRAGRRDLMKVLGLFDADGGYGDG